MIEKEAVDNLAKIRKEKERLVREIELLERSEPPSGEVSSEEENFDEEIEQVEHIRSTTNQFKVKTTSPYDKHTISTYKKSV
jgi:hypothetical protein